MEGVEHRSKLPGEGKQESPCVGGTEAYWREDMLSEPSSPGDSPRSAWMIERPAAQSQEVAGIFCLHGCWRAQQSQLPDEGSE